MADLLEIGDIIFNKQDVEDIVFDPPETTILYGIALTDSRDGKVTVMLDDPVYSSED